MATSRQRFSYISQMLTTTGQPDGSNEQAVDGSVTPVLFRISPSPTGRRLFITRMIVVMRNTGMVTEETYAGLAELTNGVDVGLYDNDTLVEVQAHALGGIKTTADWSTWSGDTEVKGGPPGDSFVLVRWSFAPGLALILDSSNNYSFGLRVNDDLTGLVSQSAIVQGSLV